MYSVYWKKGDDILASCLCYNIDL